MLEAALAGLFGLLIGSFLNVCIFRLPRDLSVVRPRSFCPGCEKMIAWYDNIPLFSFLRLKGRCRHCGERIPLRYPIVEALTAVLFFLFVGTLGLTPAALKFCLFSALQVGMIFSDFEERILPDEFTIGGAVVGLALSWWIPVQDGTAAFFLLVGGATLTGHLVSVAESIFGAVVPSCMLWLIGELVTRLKQKEALGFGDVKMMAMIGAFLGIRGAFLILTLGCIMGSVIGLVGILVTKERDHEFPLGTYLGIAALGVGLTGQHVFAWFASAF